MTGTELVKVTEAVLTKRRGRSAVTVAPRFKAWARSNQKLLQRALRRPRDEVNLAATLEPAALVALGFSFDSQLAGFCYPDGDQAGEAVILGLEKPRGPLPEVPLVAPVVRIEAEQVSPGKFKWSEPPGVRAQVFYRGRRLA